MYPFYIVFGIGMYIHSVYEICVCKESETERRKRERKRKNTTHRIIV